MDNKKLYQLNNIVLNVTDRCNLKCKYCFTNPNPRVLTLPKAKRIIQWTLEESEGNFVVVNFFGGEPMLEFANLIKPLIEWIKYKDLPIGFGMTTNGTLLSDSKIKWLAKNGVNILLSIDGGPETQNLNRPFKSGVNSFESVVKNIPTLLTYMPNTTFRSTLEPDNISKMFENFLWANKLGFRLYAVIPNEFNQWSEENLYQMAEGIRSIYWEMYRQVSNLQFTTVPLAFDDSIRILFNKPTPQENLIGRCGLGTSSVGIGANGEIFGCQEYNTWDTDSIFYLGNVFEGGIIEKRREALIKKFLEGNPSDGSGCISHNYKLSGNFGQTTEVMKVLQGSTLSTVAEILDHAAKEDNQVFLNFILQRINSARR